MTIRGIRPVACERPMYSREARTRQSEAHGAIEQLGETFAKETPSLMGRVSMGDRASHLAQKIQATRDLSLLNKGIATCVVNHIVPKLSWAERPSSLDGLIEISLASLDNISEACGYRRDMTAQEQSHYGRVITARNKLQHAENPAEEKKYGAIYKDSIAANIGYENFKDLKKQALRSVAKHAGDFVTEDKPVNFFTRIFQALYKAIIGMAAKYAVNNQLSKIGAIASKYYMKCSSDEQSSRLVKAESEVFAYHMLDFLMTRRREILSEGQEQIYDASDLHEALMGWLTPQQIDQ